MYATRAAVTAVTLAALCAAGACSSSDKGSAPPETDPPPTGSSDPAPGVQGLWPMTLASPEAKTTAALEGDADIDLQGRYSAVPGAVGGAIRFDFANGATLGTARKREAFAPDAQPFAVAAYFRTDTVPLEGDYSPNIVQKGLFGSSGQWKMQLKATPDGTVAGCRFSGSELPKGSTVKDHTATALDDGDWHAVVCWREADEYGITVDGQDSVEPGEVGTLSSALPLRIANKSPTAGIEDQFQGSLDCIAYVEGIDARITAAAQLPC